jgi:hypothetical protein
MFFMARAYYNSLPPGLGAAGAVSACALHALHDVQTVSSATRTLSIDDLTSRSDVPDEASCLGRAGRSGDEPRDVEDHRPASA